MTDNRAKVVPGLPPEASGLPDGKKKAPNRNKTAPNRRAEKTADCVADHSITESGDQYINPLFLKGKINGAKDEGETHEVFPVEGLPQVPDGEYGEYHQGDDLLRDLELEAREAVGITEAVCGHHQAVFEEGDAPGDEYGLPERHAGILQVAVPGNGHEDVGGGKEQDGAEHGSNYELIIRN